MEYIKYIIIPSIQLLLALIVGCIIGTLTYRKNQFQKRFEFFYGIKNRMLDDERIKTIDNLLIKESNNNLSEGEIEQLKNIPAVDKYFLLVMYEQVAVALNSGLIKERVAHHMFGYRAI